MTIRIYVTSQLRRASCAEAAGELLSDAGAVASRRADGGLSAQACCTVATQQGRRSTASFNALRRAWRPEWKRAADCARCCWRWLRQAPLLTAGGGPLEDRG